MDFKRVSILVGYYGSGKTSLAVSLAERLRESGKPVVVADLDIVNPYFRTTDHRQELKERGIEILTASDAHRPEDIGEGIAELMRLTEEV